MDPRFPADVRIAPAALTAIDAHARVEAPHECCGLLLGQLSDDAAVIEQAVPTHNIAPSPTTRYLIDPTDHFRILREARRAGTTIVGAYHSHPATAPVPSPTDLADAFANFLYLIASPLAAEQGSDVRAWWLLDGNFREIPLVTLS